jgi:hypothetical protein
MTGRVCSVPECRCEQALLLGSDALCASAAPLTLAAKALSAELVVLLCTRSGPLAPPGD